MGASILALPNCSDAEMLANVRINAARNLPWVEPREAHDGHAVLLGGGPSLADCLPEIQWRAERGQLIFALNGTARWLTDRGIIVDYGVILDARPSNAAFVGGIQPGAGCWRLSATLPPLMPLAPVRWSGTLLLRVLRQHCLATSPLPSLEAA